MIYTIVGFIVVWAFILFVGFVIGWLLYDYVLMVKGILRIRAMQRRKGGTSSPFNLFQLLNDALRNCIKGRHAWYTEIGYWKVPISAKHPLQLNRWYQIKR